MKRHCDLCEHQKLSLQKGDLCGVTNRKPDFNRTCTSIDFGDKLLDELEEVLVDYEDLKLNKKKIYKSFISGSIIGFFLLICGYLVFDYFFNDEYRVSFDNGPRAFFNYIAFLIIVSGSFIITGFLFTKKAIINFLYHKKKLIETENNISEIDEVLNLYNQKYKYKITFDKEIHGTQEIDIEIELT
ncbi:hypothetical protein [uncultured Polaribacter sp.]|uniref:hypothetical protein n=1 Tax=uncultured Polaribacter sp. TaxID=174711 RepID=UPI002611ADDC|nr:hypothetical protein [uncultured Polaribacter sp.]